MKRIYTGIFLAISLLATSCGYFDGTDEVPMFIEINSIDFKTDPGEGAATARFQGVSVFADGFSIGVFPVPSTVPVLDLNDDGTSEITIFPVIRNNGIGSNPIQYPYYDSEEFVFDFEPEKITGVDLEFGYVDNTVFVIQEDFETSSILGLSIDQVPETEFTRSMDTPYGDFCAQVTTTDDFRVFEEATLFAFHRDDLGNSPVFLEMDYRNDIPFKVGVIKYASFAGQREYKIVLTESEEWNKIYIELTDLLGGQDYEEFQLVFGSISASGAGSVSIDNLKLTVLN